MLVVLFWWGCEVQDGNKQRSGGKEESSVVHCRDICSHLYTICSFVRGTSEKVTEGLCLEAGGQQWNLSEARRSFARFVEISRTARCVGAAVATGNGRSHCNILYLYYNISILYLYCIYIYSVL